MEVHAMKIITQINQNDKKVFSSVSNFLKRYKISSALKVSNAYKKKGVPIISIFHYLFSLIFTNRTMYMNMLMGKNEANFSKDTVYRFLNSININWIRFTTLLAGRIINDTIKDLTSKDRVNVLIVDDTSFERNRSKKVELLSKIYDHAKKKYSYGFRLLTLGWSDGNTFLPINSCLLSTKNAKNRINEAADVDKRTAGYRRRKLSQTKATSVVLDLLKAAKSAAIPASYVLFDTWFCSPSSLVAVKKIGYDVIAMAKKTSKIHYLYDGEMQPLTKIYRKNRKRRGRSRYLLSVEVTVVKDNEFIPARIVYVRNRNKRKEYLALITTDMTLSEDEIIRIYGKRWDIEVFFKVCKSYLKLSKECRSLSYDAMTAHVAIVFTRYMMLSVENRKHSDNRTLGQLFYYFIDEMSDVTWIQAIHMLMEVFIDTIKDKLSLTSKQLDQLLETFVKALPKELVEYLPLCA